MISSKDFDKGRVAGLEEAARLFETKGRKLAMHWAAAEIRALAKAPPGVIVVDGWKHTDSDALESVLSDIGIEIDKSGPDVPFWSHAVASILKYRAVTARARTEIEEAALQMLECSACDNGCAPDDMTCATSRLRAALALLKEKRP